MKTEVEIDLSADDLAKIFVQWSSYEQGEFFNLIGKHFKIAKFSAQMQISYISDAISRDGRDFLFTLANFHKARGVSADSPKAIKLLNFYENLGL